MGGGVPSVGRFFLQGLERAGYDVTVFDLAVSRADSANSSLISPRSWRTGPRIVQTDETGHEFRAGAHLGELEVSRYLSRRGLTSQLNRFDLVQMVSGTPAWGNVLANVVRPRILQVATTTRQERAHVVRGATPLGLYRSAMTVTASHLDQSGLNCTEHVLVENALMHQLVTLRQTPKQHVSLIPPGINTDLFRPSPRWSKEGPLISVGRLGDARKGWDRLLESYAQLVSVRPNVPNLHIIGRGPIPTELPELIDELRLSSKVRIFNDVTLLQLASHLQVGSVFLQFSFEEGLGIAALEAMASGLPVIATTTAGSSEYVVAGETGFPLPQDGAKLTEAFVAAIDVSLGPRGESMSVNAVRLVRNQFSAAAQFAKVADIYNRHLSDSA